MPTLPLSPTTRSGRAWAWALFLVGSLACLSLAQAPTARAQDDKKEAAAEAAAEPPAAPAASGDTAPAPKKSMLRWALEASGPIGIVLLVISVYMSAMIIRFFLEMKVVEDGATPALVEKLEAAIKERKFQEAYDACRDNESLLARLVRTGVANLPNGRPEAKESMNVVGDEIVQGLESKVGYLAIIGQLGPMIGLVGTMLRHDHVVPGNRDRGGLAAQTGEGGRGDLDGLVHHARRRVAVGAGDLLLLVLQEPDRAHAHGGQQSGGPDHQLARRRGQAGQVGLSAKPTGRYLSNRREEVDPCPHP